MSLFGQPFGSNYTDLQNQYLQQLQVMQQAQQAQQKTQPIPDGKVAAENLLATIRKSKEYIQSQIKAKEEKVNTLLELMESDPEMKKRFDELMMNKTAK